MPVVVDTSGAGLLAAARAGAHALKPNREELAEATGLADPLDGARALLDLGARLVVVSLGADGLLAIGRHGAPVVRADCPGSLHGNATGAGDAAVAAIAVSLAAGDDLAVEHGCRVPRPIGPRPPRDRLVGERRAHAARRRALHTITPHSTTRSSSPRSDEERR